jgi:hypothetical protein
MTRTYRPEPGAGADEDMGPVEAQVRQDIEGLGELEGIQPGLAELAYRLANLMDDRVAGMAYGPLAKELRATIQAIREEGEGDDETAAAIASLGSPVGAGMPPAVGHPKNVEPANARAEGRRSGKAAGVHPDAVAAVRRRRSPRT